MADLRLTTPSSPSSMADEIIETIGDDFGVTVIYELSDYRHVRIQFFAAEIVGRRVPDNAPLYTRKGADGSGDHVEDPHQAERFVAGIVKWDACSHFYFGDEEGYLHLCGYDNIEKLAKVLSAIFERCGELMQQHGGNLLELEFVANGAQRGSVAPSS